METVELYESDYELFEERSIVGFLQISAKLAVTVNQIINNTSIQRRVSLSQSCSEFEWKASIMKLCEERKFLRALTDGFLPLEVLTFKLGSGSLYVLKISAPASSEQTCQEAQQPSWWVARRLLVLPSVFDQTKSSLLYTFILMYTCSLREIISLEKSWPTWINNFNKGHLHSSYGYTVKSM